MEMQQVDKEQVWDAERGFYGQHVDANHPPQRVLSSGAANSYTALLRRNKHFIPDKCAPPNAGFKVSTPYISFLLLLLKLQIRCPVKAVHFSLFSWILISYLFTNFFPFISQSAFFTNFRAQWNTLFLNRIYIF